MGRADLSADDFNDDCLARALERLEDSEFHPLYGTILLNLRQVYPLHSRCCHADTNSMVVFGDYDDPAQTLVDFGFSKGLCVDSNGLPIYGKPVDGNQDDKTWSKELLKKFKDVVNSELAQTLVADSQLITSENLRLMHEQSIAFISRLPDTFKISEELKEQAWRENTWQEVGSMAQTPGSASYRIQELPGMMEGIPYRFIVANSSSLDKRREKSMVHEIEKEEQRLTNALKDPPY